MRPQRIPDAKLCPFEMVGYHPAGLRNYDNSPNIIKYLAEAKSFHWVSRQFMTNPLGVEHDLGSGSAGFLFKSSDQKTD